MSNGFIEMSKKFLLSKSESHVHSRSKREMEHHPTAFDTELLRTFPKVELHAHLNGSLSVDTMQKLSQLKYGSNDVNIGEYQMTSSMNLHEAFKLFKYAHDLTDSTAAVGLATKCVIADFAADNVVYLELRTTPRATATMTKDEYIIAVIEAIEQSKSSQPAILVKLILSINRRESLEAAAENVELLMKYRKSHPTIVCGIDLSGDPACKTFADFKPLLSQVKGAGIPMALHCGETENDVDVATMLDFGFDRLGHGTFVRNENEQKLLANKNITVECCLTSNVFSETVSNYAAHHFRKYFDCGHPVVICTDDFGVFNTTLTKELLIATKTFGLQLDDIRRLQQTAVQSSFASNGEKESISEQILAFMKKSRECSD